MAATALVPATALVEALAAAAAAVRRGRGTAAHARPGSVGSAHPNGSARGRPGFVDALPGVELGDLVQHPLRLGDVVDVVDLRELDLLAGLVVVDLLHHLELHHVRGKVGVLERLLVRGVVVVVQLVEVGSLHAHDGVALVAERGDPVLAGVVGDGHVEDVAPLAVGDVLAVVALAVPGARGLVVPELLLAHALAVQERARGVVRTRILGSLDVGDVAAALHPERGVGAELRNLILELREGDAAIALAAAAAAAAAECGHRRGRAALGVVPVAELGSLGEVGVDVDVGGADGADVLTLKLAHAAVLDGEHGVFSPVDHSLELAADVDRVRCPHGELDGRAAVVAEVHGSLVGLAAVALHDGGEVADGVHDADDVSHAAHEGILDGCDLLELVVDLLDARGGLRVGALLDHGAVVEANLKVGVVELFVLDVGDLALLDVVHAASLEHLREPLRGVVEAHSLDLTAFGVQQVDVEHLAVAPRVVVGANVRLVGHAHPDHPAVHVRVERGDGGDPVGGIVALCGAAVGVLRRDVLLVVVPVAPVGGLTGLAGGGMAAAGRCAVVAGVVAVVALGLTVVALRLTVVALGLTVVTLGLTVVTLGLTVGALGLTVGARGGRRRGLVSPHGWRRRAGAGGLLARHGLPDDVHGRGLTHEFELKRDDDPGWFDSGENEVSGRIRGNTAVRAGVPRRGCHD